MANLAESLGWEEESSVEQHNRVKVVIRCRKCGEKFMLRGSVDPQGEVNTGFKRCLCSNERDFEIRKTN